VLKDYYKILEIEPSAGIAEIKRAYRRLALLFHPDKNIDNPEAAARYEEIKEAYETLIHPSKKQTYLQKRWLLQSQGRKPVVQMITPEHILKQVLELEKNVSRMDPYRFNSNAFRPFILDLTSDTIIEKLDLYTDKTIHRQIVHHLLKTIRPLHNFNPDEVISQLKKMMRNYPEQVAELDRFRFNYFKKQKLENFRLLLIFLITLLLTLLIYFAGR